VNSTEFGALKWPEFWKFIHYCTFGLEAVNDAQNVRVDTTHRKDEDQQNL